MDSKIDWTKPVQVLATDHGSPPIPVTVVKTDDGNRMIQWKAPKDGSTAVAFGSEHGNLMATLHNAPRSVL